MSITDLFVANKKRKEFFTLKKTVAVISALLLVLVMLASCGNSANKLVGSWKGEITALGITTEYTYTFNEDGTGTKASNLVSGVGTSFTYTVGEDGNLTISSSILGIATTETYSFEIKSGVLTLTDTSDSSVITLTKIEA